MRETMEYLIGAVPVGVGATALMDLVAMMRKRLFAVPSADYGLVGRWLAYFPRGRFRHHPINTSPPIRGEQLIGWTAHYAIGIAFATVLLLIGGHAWTCHPTIGPAFIVGIGSVAAPFLLMQPGMGMGIAASGAPRPGQARLRSLTTHTIFGIALYVAGTFANWLALFNC